jgi:hypothetical protein
VLRRRSGSKRTRTQQVQRRLSQEQVAQLVAEYRAGDSMQKLAKRWGPHRTTVAEHLHRAGIPSRQHGIPDEVPGLAANHPSIDNPKAPPSCG